MVSAAFMCICTLGIQFMYMKLSIEWLSPYARQSSRPLSLQCCSGQNENIAYYDLRRQQLIYKQNLYILNICQSVYRIHEEIYDNKILNL